MDTLTAAAHAADTLYVQFDVLRAEVAAVGQVVAHSVGTWNAFEFLKLARRKGLPMPRHAFLSAMAAPDIPLHERPWRRQRTLSEAQFQVGCLHWKSVLAAEDTPSMIECVFTVRGCVLQVTNSQIVCID
jgi:surfactin synthase thioesterase subunit